jgi:hypothetical protein
LKQNRDISTEPEIKLVKKERKKRAAPAPKLEPEKKKVLKAQYYVWMYCASDQEDMDKCKADVDRYKPDMDIMILLDRS